MTTILEALKHQIESTAGDDRISVSRTHLGLLIEAAEALRHAARTFRAYEAIHAAKNTTDGDLKAMANARHAQAAEAILSRLQEPSQ